MANKEMTKAVSEWKLKLKEHEAKHPPIKPRYTTLSDMEVPLLCTSEDIKHIDEIKDIGFPGEFPYTRGVHINMYRGKMWTMRQFSGFGSPADTNRRYKALLANGQTGLSVAFDMPTLMGYDSSSALSRGEVGKCGVAVDTLDDMHALFDGIDLSEITTSMTINSPAPILLAMYVAVAESKGVPRSKIRGTLQNDILKEYIAQKEWMFPPKPSMRLIADTLEFCTNELPNWNSISISGYHIREAGATAVQELAFTLADGMAYVESGIQRGLDVDSFAPRLSYFWDVHNDFFEEIAKFRAGRRIWARLMRDRYGAKNPKSWMLRCHAQTAGVSLTAQQPVNNVARVTMQALAAVLGGTNSLHTNPVGSSGRDLPIEKLSVYNDETFGPIVAVTKFTTTQEAVDKANNSPYGLLATVITKDLVLAEQIATKLEVGTVIINEVIYTHGLAETPWGGVKNSGFGVVHSDEGLYEFVHKRHVHTERFSALSFKSPWWFPYTEKQLSTFRLMMDVLYRRSIIRRLIALPNFLYELIELIKKGRRI